jgi:hypothetical protein
MKVTLNLSKAQPGMETKEVLLQLKTVTNCKGFEHKLSLRTNVLSTDCKFTKLDETGLIY